MSSANSYAFNGNEIGATTRAGWLSATNTILIAIFSGAFLVRCLVRFSYGEEYFWRNSYSLFYDLSQSVAQGRGLCYEWAGLKCAYRPPVYPLFVTLSTLGGRNYVAIVILQSIMGAGTALCAYFIGTELFDRKTGLLAALGVAVYPYFVMHDTALQETGLFTLLTALSVLFLLKSRRSSAKQVWVIAGISLGLAVLTRATLAVFIPFALLWLLFFAGLPKHDAVRRAGVVAIAFVLTVSPWLIRNYLVVGTPTLSTLTGLTLWAGNNPYTFANYPAGSIDGSVARASMELPQQDKEAIKSLSSNEVAQNAWYMTKALDYMKTNRSATVRRAFSKLGAAFSWKQNPAREGFVQTVYFLSYVPALVFAIAGAWMSRKRWRENGAIYGLFISFVVVTAVFFAHTSHRVYLDVYLLVFGAYAVTVLLRLISNNRTRTAAAA